MIDEHADEFTDEDNNSFSSRSNSKKRKTILTRKSYASNLRDEDDSHSRVFVSEYEHDKQWQGLVHVEQITEEDKSVIRHEGSIYDKERSLSKTRTLSS